MSETGGLTYCDLDRRRLSEVGGEVRLSGDACILEIRPARRMVAAAADRTDLRHRAFVFETRVGDDWVLSDGHLKNQSRALTLHRRDVEPLRPPDSNDSLRDATASVKERLERPTPTCDPARLAHTTTRTHAAAMNEPAIRCTGLRKSYGSVRALDGVDVTMPAGSIFGFLGPNGAGKTTTIKVLLGLTLPDEGQASIYGVPVEQYSAQSRREVGYLAQEPAYPRWMTGREVLDFVGRLYPLASRPVADRTRDALKLVELEAAADRKCGGYSGGMRQRLGIAQALMGDPKLVMLDEPSSSLDPVGRRDVLAILRTLRDRGISVFYSTHILDDVERVADYIAIMKDGRVVREGDMRVLMSASQDRFRLTVESPADKLVGMLGALPWVRGVEPVESADNRTTLLVDVEDGTAAKRSLPRAVIDADFVLIGCEPARSRLEDIFMESIGDAS